MRRRIGVLLFLEVACLTMFVPVANAYVDPGAGSFVFQAMIGGLLAAGVVVKVFWKRFTTLMPWRRHDGDTP